jgi:hypothetical protein
VEQLGFTVAEAMRQLGCSDATVRSWLSSGKLVSVAGSRPLAIERAGVLRARAEVLSKFDGVADVSHRTETGNEPPQGGEVVVLRQRLRAVLASIESFDEGWASLRTAQRIILDSLLDDIRLETSEDR